MDALREIEMQLRRRGFATRVDAVGAGVPDSTFTDLAARLGLTDRHTGLWAPSEAPLPPRRAAEAALAVVGEPALLTGATGLALLGVTEAAQADAEVVVPLRRSPVSREGICVHHTSTYDDVRSQTVDGLSVARAERCFMDLAAHATHKEITTLVAHADRRRLVTLGTLDAEVARRKRFPGRTLIRRAIAEMRDEVVHSAYERLGRRLLREAGHKPHRRPLTVTSGQRLVAEIDISFEARMYGVEIDGPHHLLADVAAADRTRDRRLEDLGWQIDRFFWFELDERPRWFVAEVTRRLAARISSR